MIGADPPLFKCGVLLIGKNKYSGRQKNKAEDNNSPQNFHEDPNELPYL